MLWIRRRSFPMEFLMIFFLFSYSKGWRWRNNTNLYDFILICNSWSIGWSFSLLIFPFKFSFFFAIIFDSFLIAEWYFMFLISWWIGNSLQLLIFLLTSILCLNILWNSFGHNMVWNMLLMLRVGFLHFLFINRKFFTWWIWSKRINWIEISLTFFCH